MALFKVKIYVKDYFYIVQINIHRLYGKGKG